MEELKRAGERLFNAMASVILLIMRSEQSQRLYEEFSCMHENKTDEVKKKQSYEGEVMSVERSKEEMGEMLKAARVDAGYTQESFAEIAGMTRNEIRGFERGTGAFNCHKLYRFTFHLGLNPSDIMFKEGD